MGFGPAVRNNNRHFTDQTIRKHSTTSVAAFADSIVVQYLCVFLFPVLLSLNMNDIQETCQKNAAAALTVGRRDVAKVTILSFYICLFFLNKTEHFSQQPGAKQLS